MPIIPFKLSLPDRCLPILAPGPPIPYSYGSTGQTNRFTRLHSGYAFVELGCPEDVVRAIDQLHGGKVLGHQIVVTRSRGNRKHRAEQCLSNGDGELEVAQPANTGLEMTEIFFLHLISVSEHLNIQEYLHIWWC